MSKISRKLTLVLGLAVLTASLNTAAKSDEQTIDERYAAWVVAANERDLQKWSEFLAEDPFFSPPGTAPLTSTEAILEHYKQSFADPHFSLDCEQHEVQVSSSADMAWSRGVCNATFSDENGNRAKGTSRWFKVWAKSGDGLWRGRVNSWKYINER